jgi:hypothetical protein
MRDVPESAGLCHNCRHARLIVTKRGSGFVFCEASLTDKALAKYPALPRLDCHGYLPDESEPDPGRA